MDVKWLIIPALAFLALAVAFGPSASRMGAAPRMPNLIAINEIEELEWENCECVEKDNCPIYELQPHRREQRNASCRWIGGHRRAVCEYDRRLIDLEDWGGADLPDQELAFWTRIRIVVRGDRRHHRWCIASMENVTAD